MSAVGDRLLIGQLLGPGTSQGAAYLVDPATGTFLHTYADPAGGSFQNFPSTVTGSGGRALLSGDAPDGSVIRIELVEGDDAPGGTHG